MIESTGGYTIVCSDHIVSFLYVLNFHTSFILPLARLYSQMAWESTKKRFEGEQEHKIIPRIIRGAISFFIALLFKGGHKRIG